MTMQSASVTQTPPCIAHVHGHRHAMPSSITRPASWQPKTQPRCTRMYAGEAPSAAEITDLASAGDPSATALAPNREGYRSFVMQGCEFLVRQTPDGALVLNESFVLDEETGSSSRPTIVGDIPSDPRFFQPAEMAVEYPGNAFESKEEKRTVLKVYLATIKSQDPYILDIEQFYLLDSAKRSLEKLEVKRLAPMDTPDHEIRVRIRERSVVIDSATSVPTPEAVVQAAMQGGTAMSKLEHEARARGETAAGVDSSVEGVDTVEESVSASSAVEDYSSRGEADVLYDDDLLKDFLVEVDDEADENEYDEFDMPASDY